MVKEKLETLEEISIDMPVGKKQWSWSVFTVLSMPKKCSKHSQSSQKHKIGNEFWIFKVQTPVSYL